MPRPSRQTGRPGRGRLAALLAVVALVATSGCTGELGQPGGPDGRSCTPDAVTPVPYPERPDALSNATVGGFVTEIERAHVLSREADAGTDEVSFDPATDSIRPVGDGWAVRIESGYSTDNCHDGVLMHGDGYYVARYFVNDTHVLRLESGGAGPVADPRRNGTQLPVPPAG